jgi:hypothetical protein
MVGSPTASLAPDSLKNESSAPAHLGSPVMQPKPDESAVLPHSGGAANEQLLLLVSDTPRESGTSPTSWDPVEVWRSRIKAVYDARVTRGESAPSDDVANETDALRREVGSSRATCGPSSVRLADQVSRPA